MAMTTDDQIEIDVHDDAAALARIFTLPVAARLEALAEMQGVSAFDQIAMSRLRQTHETGDGFRVSVDDPRYAPALQRLVDADAWGQVRRDLARAWEYQRAALPGIRHPERIDVTLTLGNPDDPVFVDRTLGYYGMGAVPGTIFMVAWPTDYNLTRIGACAVHELAHTCAPRTSRRVSTSRSGSSTRGWPRCSRSRSAVRTRQAGGTRRSPGQSSTRRSSE